MKSWAMPVSPYTASAAIGMRQFYGYGGRGAPDGRREDEAPALRSADCVAIFLFTDRHAGAGAGGPSGRLRPRAGRHEIRRAARRSQLQLPGAARGRRRRVSSAPPAPSPCDTPRCRAPRPPWRDEPGPICGHLLEGLGNRGFWFTGSPSVTQLLR